MKKIITVVAIGVASCLSSFADGFFIFDNSSATGIRENLSTSGGAYVLSPGTIRIGLLWNATPGSSIPALGLSPSAPGVFAPAATWSMIASAPGWNWATNPSTSQVLMEITRSTPPLIGTFNAGVVGIVGASPGQTISAYGIGWDATYPTPFAAAAAGSPLGWYNPANLFLGTEVGVGDNYRSSLQGSMHVAIPEPGIVTLAGLGAAMMLIARQRK